MKRSRRGSILRQLPSAKKKAPKVGSAREGRAVKRLTRRARIAAEYPELAKWSRYGVTGVGLGLIGGGRVAAGTLLAALGISGHFAFKRLETGAQKRLIAALIGKPKLTEAVCRRIVEPELESKLRALGKIYLPRQEMIELRKSLLRTRKFDHTEFLAEVKPLVQLGSLREQHRGLTEASVKAATEIMGAKLGYPLLTKGKLAAKLAINIVKIVEPGNIRFTAAKEIAEGVVSLRGRTAEAVDVALHLIRRASRVPPETKIRSHVLAHKGLGVELKVYPDGTKKLVIGPAKWTDLIEIAEGDRKKFVEEEK